MACILIDAGFFYKASLFNLKKVHFVVDSWNDLKYKKGQSPELSFRNKLVISVLVDHKFSRS